MSRAGVPNTVGSWTIVRWVVLALLIFTGLVGLVYTAMSEKGLFVTPKVALWTTIGSLLAVTLVLDAVVRSVQRGAEGVASGPTNPASAMEHRRDGLKGLVIGADLRASTSKLQAVLWTYAVLFVFTYLLLVERIVFRPKGCPADGSDGPSCRLIPPVDPALQGALAKLVAAALQPEYIVLLGLPVGLAIAAKALTTNKVATGALVKPDAIQDGVKAGLAEVVTDDQGRADLLDFQYALFNLYTLSYFLVQFATHQADGLPELPPTLLMLSGVSGAAYITKKTLETSVGPSVTRVVPSRIVLTKDEKLTLVGAGFLEPCDVLLDGRLLGGARNVTPTRCTVDLPTDPDELNGLTAKNGAELVVMETESGVTSTPLSVDISDAPPADA